MLKSNSKLAVLAAIGALVAPLVASAAPKTVNFDVSMKIVADCTIGANGIDFGQNQGVITAAMTATSTINVTCTNTTPYNVGLNAGTGTGSSGTNRFMTGAANAANVKFNLYQSPGAGLWGNTQGTDTMAGTGNGNAQTLTVHGEIPFQTTPAPDTYKSTVTATVYF